MNLNTCLPKFWVITLHTWRRGAVHRTITLACLIFELLPFVYFHTWFLSGAYLKNYTSYGYEILWVNRSHQGGVQCIWTLTLACLIFSSPEHEVLRVSYCDHSPSVRHLSVVCPSVFRSHFLVYTLASTNINQSAPNLLQVYITKRFRMSLILELIRPELSELSALELENLPYLTLFTL